MPPGAEGAVGVGGSPPGPNPESQVPVFINDKSLTVESGIPARDAVARADPAWREALDSGRATLTDGRGIPLDPGTPLTAGAIVRLVVSARRAPSAVGAGVWPPARVPSLDLIRRLPKAELHTHLDGAVRPGTMIELAREAGVGLPAGDPDSLLRFMQTDDAANLEQYLARFEHTIALLQTGDAIERVAYELVEDAARDGVRYLEVRYCPLLSTRRGLPVERAIEAEWRGLSRGEHDFGVVTRIINCSLRHYDPSVSVALARVSVDTKALGVVGFDLAGGEAGRPPGIHAEAFEIARAGGLGLTVHAGEAAGADSIREALFRCHAERIGHGTRLHEDPELLAYVRDRGIVVEINITSNLRTRAVATAAAHPVRRYFDAGVPVTLCTDGWLMSGVELSDEYRTAVEALGFTRAELDRVIMTGFAGAFLPGPDKQALLTRVRSELVDVV